MDTEPTRVVFRRYPDGQIVALFPDVPFLPGDAGSACVSSYTHVGQHAGADYTVVMRQSRPATSDESAELQAELELIGYRLQPTLHVSEQSWAYVLYVENYPAATWHVAGYYATESEALARMAELGGRRACVYLEWTWPHPVSIRRIASQERTA